jgi:hypothetical protein
MSFRRRSCGSEAGFLSVPAGGDGEDKSPGQPSGWGSPRLDAPCPASGYAPPAYRRTDDHRGDGALRHNVARADGDWLWEARARGRTPARDEPIIPRRVAKAASLARASSGSTGLRG